MNQKVWRTDFLGRSLRGAALIAGALDSAGNQLIGQTKRPVAESVLATKGAYTQSRPWAMQPIVPRKVADVCQPIAYSRQRIDPTSPLGRRLHINLNRGLLGAIELDSCLRPYRERHSSSLAFRASIWANSCKLIPVCTSTPGTSPFCLA